MTRGNETAQHNDLRNARATGVVVMRYSSARQMVWDAYQIRRDSVLAAAIEKARLGVDIQYSQRQNNDWRIVHGLEAGAVIAAIERLPQHLQSMARYCWGPFAAEELAEDREWLHASLVRAMMGRRLPGQGHDELPPADSVRTLQALCWAAIHHHSQVTYPYNRPGLYSPKRIQRWLEEERGQTIDVRRWSAAGRLSWSDVWRRMLTVLDDWESQALGPVAELIPQAA